jgi:hypothetical protein
MTDCLQKCATKERSVEICPDESIVSWKDDIKFPAGMQFLFKTLLFMVGEDGDLELQAHDHEERCTTPIAFEYPRGLTNSATMFSAVVGYWALPLNLI